MKPELKPGRGFRFFWGVLVGAISWVSGAADWSPPQGSDQNWKIQSFLDDAGLKEQVVFNLDFERDKASPRWRTFWLAT